MKNFIIIFSLLLSGCSHFSNHPKIDVGQAQMMGEIYFDNRTDSILRLFIDKCYCDDCAYELYIDKQSPFEYRLVMRSVLSTEDYLQKNHPVNYASINGNVVFIYSGIEDFINQNTYLPAIDTKKTNESTNNILHSWSYVILKDTSFLIENLNLDEPIFFNAIQMPNVVFEAPK